MRFEKYYFQETKLNNWDSIKQSNPEIRNAIEILDKINAAGFEALMVGGVVRDLVLGNNPNDVDITTNATPDEIEKIFGRTIDIGKNKAMGVTVIPYKGQNVEIATYRKDLYSGEGGKGADKVELTTSFKDDASRRDFTINQLGIDKDGNIIDHHGGLDHIEKKVVAAVGDPNLRFKEDEVRVLRGIRFASRLGFDIDKETLEAMKSHAPEIKKVAQERILKELTSMAKQSGSKFADAIIMLKDIGILKYVLPELVEQESMLHSPDHHPESPNVFGHVMEVLKVNKEPNALLNWCLLMHDLGKNKTYALTDKGTHSYHGHAEQSGKMIEEIGKRMKMDNDTISAIKWVAENHMKFFDILKMNNSTVATLVKSPYFDLLEKTAYCDNKSRGSLFDQKEWDDIQEKIEKVRNMVKGKDIVDPVKKVINGALIMKLRPDIKQGIQFGKIIKDTIDYVLNNEIDINDMKSIEKFIKDWK